MSKQATFRTPQVMSAELDVSAATLRRWSDEFSDYLSAEAGSTPGRSHRRYTDDDATTLDFIKELMSSGMTYEQVRQRLSDQFEIWSDRENIIPADEEDEGALLTDEPHEERGLMATNGRDASAIDFITHTLATLSENQKSVLNSQAANRELLGVLIQDNFNLKEENNQLRQRLLDVERNLSQTRQEEEWRRESLRQELDAKIMQTQQLASQALATASTPQDLPDIKAVQTKPGCLGALFGGGDIKIVSTPGRRRKGNDRPQQSFSAPSGPAPSSQAPAPPIHPKPTRPPE
jgi:DNA-binding transcriptional MerR regulator